MSLRLASLHAVLCTVGALSGCRARPATAPTTARPVPVVEWSGFAASQPPIASSRVSAGVLEGLVIDEKSAQPINAAQIWFAPSTVSTVTDSTGRFRVALPRAGYSIRIRRIGFDPHRVDAVLQRDSGYVMVAALTRTRAVLCQVTAGPALIAYLRDAKGRVTQRHLNTYVPRSGVIIIARDALTGRAPSTPLSITVRDRDYRDSLVVTADSLGRVARTIAPDRPGTYEVTVRSPESSAWRASAATQPVTGCPGEFVPAAFQVWLVPR